LRCLDLWPAPGKQGLELTPVVPNLSSFTSGAIDELVHGPRGPVDGVRLQEAIIEPQPVGKVQLRPRSFTLGDEPKFRPKAQPRIRVMSEATKRPPVLNEERTTVVLRNLPDSCTRAIVLALLQNRGFAVSCDFLYLPMQFKLRKHLGYAFLNFVSHAEAVRFRDSFDGFAASSVTVDWSEPSQGLQEHVERFRNSPVMHETVPDDWKPILLKNGQIVDFPAPTKKIKAPRLRAGTMQG